MVSVTKKFQVTIPREVREDLHIKSGDRVVFVKNPEGNWELMTIANLTKRMLGSTSEEMDP